jgi:hypothetical protein
MKGEHEKQDKEKEREKRAQNPGPQASKRC